MSNIFCHRFFFVETGARQFADGDRPAAEGDPRDADDERGLEPAAGATILDGVGAGQGQAEGGGNEHCRAEQNGRREVSSN